MSSIKILKPSGIAFFGETSVFLNRNGEYELFLRDTPRVIPNSPLILKSDAALYRAIAKFSSVEDLAKLHPKLMNGVLPLLSKEQIAFVMAEKLS